MRRLRRCCSELLALTGQGARTILSLVTICVTTAVLLFTAALTQSLASTAGVPA